MVVIYSIEGNIGSGKSTLVSYLKDNLSNIQVNVHRHAEDSITILGQNGVQQNNAPMKSEIPIIYLQEPVDTWNKIADKDGEPILTKFYKDQEKYAFSFQMMAYISRIALLRKTVKENPHSIIICERSVFTDSNVFAKMLYDDGKIEEVDYNIYKRWFDEFTQDTPINCSFYIKVTPENCEERVSRRAREGEVIPLEYLKKCGEYHDTWLEHESTKAVIIDGNIDNRENPNIMQNWMHKIKEEITLLSKADCGSQ